MELCSLTNVEKHRHHLLQNDIGFTSQSEEIWNGVGQLIIRRHAVQSILQDGNSNVNAKVHELQLFFIKSNQLIYAP